MTRNQDDPLIFHESPTVEFATNTFINVPVTLQYDDQPLIEVVRAQQAGFTTQFSIYHQDGTYLAKVKGSRLFLTAGGRKTKLMLRHPDRMTVCELEGKTLFEIDRKEAAALKTEAELYTPDGSFVKARDRTCSGMILRNRNRPLQIGNLHMQGNRLSNCRIGIQVRSDGTVGIYSS